MTDATQNPQTSSPDSAPAEGVSSPGVENFVNAVFELDQVPAGAFRDRALHALDVLFREPEEPEEERVKRRLAMYMPLVQPMLEAYIAYFSRPREPFGYTAPRPCPCRSMGLGYATPGAVGAPMGVIDPAAPVGDPMGPMVTPAPKPSIGDFLGLTDEQKASLTPEQRQRIDDLGFSV